MTDSLNYCLHGKPLSGCCLACEKIKKVSEENQAELEQLRQQNKEMATLLLAQGFFIHTFAANHEGAFEECQIPSCKCSRQYQEIADVKAAQVFAEKEKLWKNKIKELEEHLTRYHKAAVKQLKSLKAGGWGHAIWCNYQRSDEAKTEKFCDFCNCGVADLQQADKKAFPKDQIKKYELGEKVMVIDNSSYHKMRHYSATITRVPDSTFARYEATIDCDNPTKVYFLPGESPRIY